MKIFLIAGARPNFMKIAPIIRALQAQDNSDIHCKIVHTGQHYDYEMSDAFFKDLEIPGPNYFLEAGSGSHAVQTAKIMTAFEKICIADKPDMVMVVGDVNSTLACSIVAKKLQIKVAHVEAGLRSFDMSMPEEINRIVTDSISDYCFVTEQAAIDNLKREGKKDEQIFFVGHVMVDNLFYQLNRLNGCDFKLVHRDLKEHLKKYAFLTLHRPSNVDERSVFQGIAEALNTIAEELPIIFPVHPRTKKQIELFQIKLSDRIFLMQPLSFKESLFFWKDARLIITDSGGLQEETTALGVPCMTIRENTERPVTVELGTNRLAGVTKDQIINCYADRINECRKKSTPPLWDGHAAERIAQIIGSL